MKQRKRTMIAVLLVLGGLLYLIGTAVSNTTMYYVTVEEAFAQGLVRPGNAVRMSGDVQPGSIEWSPREMRLSFLVQSDSGHQSMPAVYYGPRPDLFEDGVPAILEGSFNEHGVLVVDKLMLACPSRFVAEGEEGADGVLVEHGGVQYMEFEAQPGSYGR